MVGTSLSVNREADERAKAVGILMFGFHPSLTRQSSMPRCYPSSLAKSSCGFLLQLVKHDLWLRAIGLKLGSIRLG